MPRPRSIYVVSTFFLIGIHSHSKAWSYKKKKHEKIKAYRKSLQKEPKINRCLLILDLKPF